MQYDPFDQRRARPELGITEPDFGRFKVINHIEIPKSEMHYDLAVQTVIELDKRYNPFAIYPDKGAGEYQLEMLRKALGDKVKGVFYGSTTEVRDPITRVFEKKSLKPFLVNQTTLLLERGQLRIPHKDVSEVIHRQMTNYQVIRVSEKSQEPVYTSEDEHALDAMIFALYAFINDYPDLVNIVYKTEAARQMSINKPVQCLCKPLQMKKFSLWEKDNKKSTGNIDSNTFYSLFRHLFTKNTNNRNWIIRKIEFRITVRW